MLRTMRVILRYSGTPALGCKADSLHLQPRSEHNIEPNLKETEMNITLNIGLEVSNNYLPDGVEGMYLQYEYVKDYLKQAIGTPIYIGLTQSATEKTVVVQYADADVVLQKLYWLAHEFKQDCIAYAIHDGANVLGGALIGNYAHEWNYGIFNESYFLQPIKTS